MAGYEAAMAAQRSRSQESGSFRVDYNAVLSLEGSTEFTGYDSLQGEGTVTALLCDGAEVEALGADQQGVVVLDRTPFYAESGGQVGDSGYLQARENLKKARELRASRLKAQAPPPPEPEPEPVYVEPPEPAPAPCQGAGRHGAGW